MQQHHNGVQEGAGSLAKVATQSYHTTHTRINTHKIVNIISTRCCKIFYNIVLQKSSIIGGIVCSIVFLYEYLELFENQKRERRS